MSKSDFIYAVIPSKYQSFFKIETSIIQPDENALVSINHK